MYQKELLVLFIKKHLHVQKLGENYHLVYVTFYVSRGFGSCFGVRNF
jgi:hypothetical protein